MNRKKQNKYNSDYNLEELFTDEAERQRIENLPEVDREVIIYERYTELQNQRNRDLLLGESTKTDAKKAIDDIKARRKNKTDNKTNYKESPELGELSSEEYKKTRLKKGKPIDEDSFYEEDSNASIKEDIPEESQVKPEEDKTKITELDLEKIRISRLLFEKYHSHKLFDDTVRDCYVRLNLGGKDSLNPNEGYMVVKIKDVVDVPNEPYKIGGNSYSKYFVGEHIGNEKKFSFAIISNSKFEKFEFDKWIARLEKNNQQLPSKTFVNKKENELETMKNYILSAAEIQKIVEEKRAEKIRKRDKTLNITLELENLNEKYLACKMKITDLEDDVERNKKLMEQSDSRAEKADIHKENKEKIKEIEKYKKDIEEMTEFKSILEEMQKSRVLEKNEHTLNERSYKINMKNLNNQKELDKEFRYLNKKRNQESEKTEANPFKRRECTPMNRFSKNTAKAINVKDIKMTETKEDAYVGTPKQLYDKREKDLKENRKLFADFIQGLNGLRKEDKEKGTGISAILKQIADDNTYITSTKKPFYGLFKSAELNIKDIIEKENLKLIEKYNITSLVDIPNYEFI